MDDQQTNKRKRESTDQESVITTSTPSIVRHVEWNIDNFKRLVKNKTPLRVGFEVNNTLNIPSKWKMFFTGGTSTNDSIGIFLAIDRSEKWPTDMTKIPVKFSLLINSRQDGNFAHLGPYEYAFHGTGTGAGYGWQKLLSLVALMDPTSKYLPNGTLTVKLTLEIFSKPVSIEVMDKKKLRLESLETSSQTSTLEDISNLLESGLNSDLVIATKDLKVFNAHRCILASRSPVFKAMFQTEMMENATGRVEIDDISSKAIDILLKYSYSGTLENGWTEVAEEMIYAADKYDLPLLMEICDHGLIEAVTTESAMTLLLVAKRHGLSIATGDISAFIKDNVEEVLVEFPDGGTVPELGDEVLSDLATVDSDL